MSMTVTSFENLANILPTGFESKNRIYDLATQTSIVLWMFSQALCKILISNCALQKDINMNPKIEQPNMMG